MSAQSIQLLRASRHQWGPGKVHIFENGVFGDGGKTRCGRSLAECPGRVEQGHLDNVTCLLCVRSWEAAERQAERDREYAERQAEWERGRAERRAEYEVYLASPEWRARRGKVLERAGGVCEGCGERRATQVHHLTYERRGSEMLFDLVAVCDDCHSQIHGAWR